MDMLSGIVRISSSKGIGTGFVIADDGLIATCAHILGRSRPEKVLVVFQVSGQQREAEVLADKWRDEDAEDIALLRVHEGLPPGVLPLPLGSSVGIEDHAFTTFGYPRLDQIEGARGTGIILGPGMNTIMGQPMLQLSSSEITEGFSGAPVWDEKRGRVVGMVVIAAKIDRLGKLSTTAFATPAEILQALSPTLQLSDICPYCDLAAFTENNSRFFFGRKSVVDGLVRQLQNNRRFLAVLGASGSGKSSVVQAGLIPQIRDGAIPGSKHWRIILTRPTNPSFRNQLDNLETTRDPVALVIDPFEELFFPPENDVHEKEIIDCLIKLLDYSPHVTLILVMRDDFYSRLAPHEPLRRWIDATRFSMPPMIDHKEVKEIVCEPARLVGWQFEDGLVELIIKDVLTMPQEVGSSTHLPLLELALTQLWETSKDTGRLTRKAYLQKGGVTGSLPDRAEEAYTGFEEPLRPLVQHIFEALIYLGNPEQGIPNSRRRRSVSSLVRTDDEIVDIDSIIQQLVAKRLLVTSQGDQGQPEMVEIIHDALLWKWGRLQQWINDDRRHPFLLWHQKLERHVRAWVETCRDNPTQRDEYKLIAGSELTEALGWMKQHETELSQSERDFIQASKERQEQEIQRQKRYTRRTVLVGLAGLTGIAITGSIVLLTKNQPPSQLRPLPYSYTGHSGPVLRVAWSPDGKHLASASDDQTVQVWDAASGNRLLTYIGHRGPVHDVAWSPDGKHLASASQDKTVQVWDAASGSHLFTYTGHTNVVSSVAWSLDSKHLASASWDQTVQVWDAASGSRLLTYTGHTSYVLSVAWSPDGRRLASTGDDQTVQVWDAASGSHLLTYTGNTGPVYDVAWSPDGKNLASVGATPLQVWDAAIGNQLFTNYDHFFPIESVAWSPDGKLLASSGDDLTVQICDTASGSHLFTYTGHTNTVTSVAWSPDGKLLASASQDKTVQVWSTILTTGKTEITYTGHILGVNSVNWSPDGKLLASASYDQTMQIWHAPTGYHLFTYTGHTGPVYDVAWSPDGKHLASAGDDKTAQVWVWDADLTKGKHLFTYTGHTDFVTSVAWSPDGRRLASTSQDKTVQLWDAASGSHLFTYTGHSGPVLRVAWSPDGKHLASASQDKTAQVWDSASGNHLFTYTGHNGPVTCIAWSPDGKLLASASGTPTFSIFSITNSKDKTVQVWNAFTGSHLFTYTGHTDFVYDVAWSPNSRHLASGGADQTVQVWDTTTGNHLFTYTGHTNTVDSVVWSPDGKRLASASQDKTVRIWLWLQN